MPRAASCPPSATTAATYEISSGEFANFQRLIFAIAGISLSEAKKPLLVGRLSKRLKHLGLSSFEDYFRHINAPGHELELQTTVDLLTTNETYFFREPKHFDFIEELARRHKAGGGTFRVWSAASSSGEEAFSIAMVLAETLGDTAWEIVGSDISSQVVARAQRAQYPIERATNIPPTLLRKHCLKGVGDQSGTLLIAKHLRQRVRFIQSNLLAPADGLGLFDVIMLRNVLIYFDMPTKRRVVANLVPYLRPGGYFVVGHSESLNGLDTGLISVQPTICRREAS